MKHIQTYLWLLLLINKNNRGYNMICKYCKKDFKNVSAHKPRCRKFQEYNKEKEELIVKEKLIDLYKNKEYTINELCCYFDVAHSSIKRKFNEFNIQKHSRYTERRNKKMRIKKQSYTKEENDIINKKREKTCLTKYGVNNVTKDKKIKQKLLETKLNNIDENGLNSIERGRIKNKETCLQRYGVDNVRKAPEIIAKMMKTKYKNGSKSYYVSSVSQEFFWYLFTNISNKLRNHTYFAELNKEYGIYKNNKYYYYDFVITNIKLCIEFNGDYWHCNPRLYSEDYIHPKSNLKANDIWNLDFYKTELIKKERNYYCVTIWESEYNSNKVGCIDKILDYISLSEKLVEITN